MLFVTNGQRLSELVVERIGDRIRTLMLQNYVQCFPLTESPWLLDETHRGLPCIFVGTPGAVEQHLFDSPGRIRDTVSPRQRRFVQETDLLLFDDMTELDVEVRAHLVFIVDKLRLLYASEDIVPQFVFATRRLHRLGAAGLVKRLFDGIEDNFNGDNLVLLRNRPAEKGWKLSIHTNFAVSPEEVCKKVVKWCMLNRLNVLLGDISSLLSHTNFCFERLEYLQDTVVGLINLEQNKIMKILAVVSVFLMPPTLIAGFYGMNVRLPILAADEPNANFWNWVIIIGLMAFSCLLVWILFRRKKLL